MSAENGNDPRRAFVDRLYRLNSLLDSGNRHVAADARRQLALLRRSARDGTAEAGAYAFVFAGDPPEREQEIWLLVAGLYALHPHADRARNRSLGAAMRLLVRERPSAQRRFTQLLSLDYPAMPYHLRQLVRLLESGGIALDHHLLLGDLVEIQAGRDRAHRARLRWARDFHRPPAKTPALGPAESSEPETPFDQEPA